MPACECGCGEDARKRFVPGHNFRGKPKSAEHKAKIGEAQRRAWQTSRTRMPIGSRTTDAQGYVRVKVVEGAGRWMPEHVLIMAEAIGRPLAPGEQVHHINGVRDDNRLTNLFLCRDLAQHLAIEHTLVEAFRVLMEAGLARFDREAGRYEAVLRG